MVDPSGFRAGIDLFNAHHFWHSHEAWEDAWKVEHDPQVRLLYKGMIQTAAALVHWERGNPRGLTLNWRKARAKLCKLPTHSCGLDLGGLIATMDQFEATRGEGIEPPTLVLDART